MQWLALVLVAVLSACSAVERGGTPETRLARGRIVFEQTCAVCHSVNPPAIAAPPMSHIAGHYLAEIPDTAEASQRIAEWLAGPSHEKSLLPAHAIDQWGLMPPLTLPERDRQAVAAYVLSLAAERDRGMGMGGGQRGMNMGGGAQHRHGAGQEVPPRIEMLVTEIAEPATTALRTGLITRLTAALAGGDPAAAIDVCALEALPLTDSIARTLGEGIALKRTSTRVRNPLNAPDDLESSALQWFADELAAGRSPTRYVQAADGDYRYYAPLRIAKLCLTCHGPADEMPSDVRRALQRRYPGDQAVGYGEGELRGVIRVTVPAAAIR